MVDDMHAGSLGMSITAWFSPVHPQGTHNRAHPHGVLGWVALSSRSIFSIEKRKAESPLIRR